ncbi:MAG: serine/threonine-protein kinase [candidate division Zixibacteria bacterium]
MKIATQQTNAIEKISVSNYEVTELIGSGGMANIFRAIQLSLDRPVALKIMHQHLSMNDGFIARFEKEAKQAAQLHHENIVAIIDYGHEKGDYYIAMEFIDGDNLKDLLEKQRRLPLEMCLLISHNVAEGLKYAHSQNLVHRDIKPANIILSSDGRVMIADFGIAKGDDDLSITATGQLIGSPAYMSPEQAAGRPHDHRSDIFSLGIIMYEMIAGEKPFKGETYQAMVTSIMSDKPEPLKKLRVDVNDGINNVVLKAIEKDVESRFQNVEEMSDAIYSQLERFKLPGSRKLISSFLKNPNKITEKLRSEKISNHMESALYYMTQGESRLKDARREFEDVLRFDKNNKSAKKHLSKLENHISDRIPTETDKIPVKKKTLFGILAGAAIAVLATAIFLLVSGDDNTAVSDGPQLAVDPIESTVSDITENPKSIKDTKDPIDKGKNAQADNTTPKNLGDSAKNKSKSGQNSKKKTVVKKKKTVYNYPDQNLAEYGSLAVGTNVAAEVYVDRKKYGSSNGPPIKLLPGRHFVEIKADGYRRMTRRIFTEKDKAVDVNLELVPERK